MLRLPEELRQLLRGKGRGRQVASEIEDTCTSKEIQIDIVQREFAVSSDAVQVTSILTLERKNNRARSRQTRCAPDIVNADSMLLQAGDR